MSHVNYRRKNYGEARKSALPAGGRRACVCHPPEHSKQKAVGRARKKRVRARHERRTVRIEL